MRHIALRGFAHLTRCRSPWRSRSAEWILSRRIPVNSSKKRPTSKRRPAPLPGLAQPLYVASVSKNMSHTAATAEMIARDTLTRARVPTRESSRRTSRRNVATAAFCSMRYKRSCDAWSYGCMVYEMAHGKRAWYGVKSSGETSRRTSMAPPRAQTSVVAGGAGGTCTASRSKRVRSTDTSTSRRTSMASFA